jgi:hypothetical protein
MGAKVVLTSLSYCLSLYKIVYIYTIIIIILLGKSKNIGFWKAGSLSEQGLKGNGLVSQPPEDPPDEKQDRS